MDLGIPYPLENPWTMDFMDFMDFKSINSIIHNPSGPTGCVPYLTGISIYHSKHMRVNITEIHSEHFGFTKFRRINES